MDTSTPRPDLLTALLAEMATPGWPPLCVLTYRVRLALRTQAGRAPIPSIPTS